MIRKVFFSWSDLWHETSFVTLWYLICRHFSPVFEPRFDLVDFELGEQWLQESNCSVWIPFLFDLRISYNSNKSWKMLAKTILVVSLFHSALQFNIWYWLRVWSRNFRVVDMDWASNKWVRDFAWAWRGFDMILLVVLNEYLAMISIKIE